MLSFGFCYQIEKSQATQAKVVYKQFAYCDQHFGYCYQFGPEKFKKALKWPYFV
jgi:hypothetical protein